ncbi:MAG: flagellar basal body P-ring formation protein FlgA [Deltaproteobacteria bacterium]|nr:flagellar basal body P-ring formation protein FlgA [Deltaproteobacteria bacterium]
MKQALCFFIALAFGTFLVPGPGISGQSSLSIEINREGKVLELDEVIKILEAGFQTIYPEKRYRIEIKAIHGYEKIGLPSGGLSCDVLLSEQARRGGNISGLLLFRANGREVGKTRVNGRVGIYTDVVVAAHYLGKHHELQAKDVQWVSRSLSLLPHDFLSEMKEVLGKRMTIAINRGEVLRAGIVEEPPLLRRGDRVMLLAESRQVKITTVGEVREEGRRGDRIKLVNLATRKEVSGRVLDEHTVRVDF